jgi:hypothetical protein
MLETNMTNTPLPLSVVMYFELNVSRYRGAGASGPEAAFDGTGLF